MLVEPRDRNRPRVKVSFVYDPLGRRVAGPGEWADSGRIRRANRLRQFVWEGFRLLQEIRDEVPLTYVYTDASSYDPLARIDGVESPEIF